MKYSPTKRYYIAAGQHGFGYVIMDKGNRTKPPYKRIVYGSDKEEVLKIFETIESINTGIFCVKQDWTPRLLIIKEKHGDHHFIIKTPHDLNKIAYHYICQHYNSTYSNLKKWEIPEKYNEIISDAYIEACPSVEAKAILIRTNQINKHQQTEYNNHNSLIDEVTALVTHGLIQGAYALLRDLEMLYDHMELVDFDNK